jgi:hypothetical protein
VVLRNSVRVNRHRPKWSATTVGMRIPTM